MVSTLGLCITVNILLVIPLVHLTIGIARETMAEISQVCEQHIYRHQRLALVLVLVLVLELVLVLVLVLLIFYKQRMFY